MSIPGGEIKNAQGEVQYEHGAPNTKITTQTGAKKSRASRGKPSGEVMKYPVKRTTGESEDTLLIKAIKYEPPKDRLSNRSINKEGGSTEGAMKDINDVMNDPNNSMGGIYVSGSTGGKDGNGFLNFRNTGGMDRRIRESAGADPAGFREKIEYYIELPIPQQVNDATTVSWGEDTMNILQAAAAGAAQAVVKNGVVQSAAEAITIARQLAAGQLSMDGLGEDTMRGVQKALAGTALDALGANVSANSLIGRATGQVLNSNLELLFQGVTLRSFPFNVTFSPRSRPESDMVKRIIRNLKKSMAASSGEKAFGMNGGIFIKPPDVFLLRYLSNGRDHPFLNVFKPCALTNMSVNYTGTGTYATYGDATPVNIKVSLVFKEINPVYREDYDEVQGKSGVGF